jgi:ribose/xylose/arabinose/galactoside ABC-type transport system permease subunit
MQCEACGENATFNQQYFREFDYENFTQTPLCVVWFLLLLPCAWIMLLEIKFFSKYYKIPSIL